MVWAGGTAASSKSVTVEGVSAIARRMNPWYFETPARTFFFLIYYLFYFRSGKVGRGVGSPLRFGWSHHQSAVRY